MSYGRSLPARCPACGWDAAGDLVVVDYDFDPPPIPMRVRPAVFVEDSHVMFCRFCDEELDGEILLAHARVEDARWREYVVSVDGRRPTECDLSKARALFADDFAAWVSTRYP